MQFITRVFERLFSLPRPQKKRIMLVTDVVLSIVSLVLASLLILPWPELIELVFPSILLIPLIHVAVGFIVGNYQVALRFIDNRSILSLLYPVTASSLCVLMLGLDTYRFADVVSLSIVYYLALLSWAFLVRLLPQYFSRAYPSQCEPVVIYGAGAAGRMLVNNLIQNKRYRPCAFVDDNIKLTKLRINGVGVHPVQKLPELLETYNCNKVLLAIPSSTNEQRKRMIQFLESLHVKVQTVPGLEQLLSESTKIDQVQDIDINDLLGRSPVAPNTELMHKCITDKAVLVTGAGGSIGSELCRQILLQKPKTLILYELSEFNLYQVNQDINNLKRDNHIDTNVIAAIGDVKNANRLSEFIRLFDIQTIYHAAAYKHVPIVEHNITQGIHNNIIGSYQVAKLACEYDIETCVLVSTDKAVRPTNVMGATKRLSELCFQAFARNPNCSTIFSMVRFGNVLGSSGSVVPLFKKQIKSGGPITVTHQEITRFFMTIPEASQLVIQAGAMAKGGEVFVLDMGEPVKIYDLAKKMIHLMGNHVEGEEGTESGIEIKFTGLRPGEKLYEELLIGGDVEGTSHSRIMMSQERHIEITELEQMINLLKELLREQNSDQLLSVLLRYCDGFDHQSGNNDYLKDLV